jgi:hypothetical protein
MLASKQCCPVNRTTSRANAIQVGTVNQRATIEIVTQRDEVVVTLTVSAEVEVIRHHANG